jgi:multiple sugar transport system substrate-binding protein
MPDYAANGADSVFREFSKSYAVMRPETPAYPFIATEFGKTVQDILSGGDAKSALDKAVKNINDNIKSNNGYKS